MKPCICAILIAVMSCSVMAWDKKDQDQANAKAKAAASAKAQAQAGAKANSNSNSSVNSSNANSSTTSLSETQTYKEIRQTPFAYAPEAIPTSPCIKGYSAGASSPIVAGTFGSGKVDKGCDSRETARQFALMHNFTAAAKILCSTDAAKRAQLTMEDCLAMEKPVAAALPPPPPLELRVVTVPQPPPVVRIEMLPPPYYLPARPLPPAPRRKTVRRTHHCQVQRCITDLP